jgi:trehalose 6-phosphate synthase
MARLIVVSNRVALPDQLAPTGGLAVGVLAALRGADGGIWFGWSGKTQEVPSSEPVEVERDGIRFITVVTGDNHACRPTTNKTAG